MNNADDKVKSVIDKLIDTVTGTVSEVAKAALANGKMTKKKLHVDVAIGPKAEPAPQAPSRKTRRMKRTAPSYRANKRVAAARGRTAKASAKKTVAAKNSPKRPVKKTEKKSAPKKTAAKKAKATPKKTVKERQKAYE
ncbi:MAG TPA: hypothetical protein VHN11_17495 [Xanthobacteraceae bacterium]|jgi:hypothetical protein|nr:hypothetical protein [Xanthobacteraceae bacterium]